MEPSDDQLIQSYKGGDEEAFKTLVERYSDSVFAFVRRLTGNATAAEDITQETFIKLWRSIERYRSGESFRAWLFKIARNCAIDYLRKRKTLLFSDFETDEGENPLVENLADPGTIPEELIRKADNAGLLDKALTHVSALDREILLLHYEDGLTFDEIGKIQGKPPNTVKSRHRRALAKLAQEFKDWR